jgi:hypothetical protein
MFAYFKPNYSFFFIEISLTWTNKEFVAFKIAADGKLGPNFSFSLLYSQLMFFSFGSQFHSSPSSKFPALKIAANGKFDSDFSIFAYFKPNYTFFFIEISFTWSNKKFVAFIIAADGKLSIFSTVQSIDVSFSSQFYSSRLVQNALLSKLPRTVNSIQIFPFLRILNPSIPSFSLKFHLCGQIKNLLPSKLPQPVNLVQIFPFSLLHSQLMFLLGRNFTPLDWFKICCLQNCRER